MNKYRKLLVTFATGLAAVIGQQVLHGAWLTASVVTLAVLTSLGVYAAKNEPLEAP